MLMVFIKRTTICALLISASIGLLTAVSLDEVYNRMVDRYERLNYYTAGFIQHNKWIAQDLEMKSEGKIYMTDEKTAIIYSHPAGQRMIVDEAVYLIDEKEKTVIITGIEQTEGVFTTTDIIDFFWDSSKKEIYIDDESFYRIILKPYEDLYTAEIEIKICRKDFLIKAAAYKDHHNNRVNFEFFDERLDYPIDQNLFKVLFGEDYTIIDNR